MMKYLGAVFLWICLTVAGINVSARYKKRCELFKSIILFIENLSCEINYLAKPISEIIFGICNSSYCDNLDFIKVCNDFLIKGDDFPVAWVKGIHMSELPLKSEEEEKLITLGQSIGKTDIDGQKNILKLYSEFFVSFSNKAERDNDKYYSTITVGSFLCGCALFILLI